MSKVKRVKENIFASPNQAITAYEFGHGFIPREDQSSWNRKEKYAQFEGKTFRNICGTTSLQLNSSRRFPIVNEEMNQEANFCTRLMNSSLPLRHRCDSTNSRQDQNFGYRTSQNLVSTWGIDNVKVPEGKESHMLIVDEKKKKSISQYNEGLAFR
jgi:hypothetical protein